jgi:cobalamin biosynthesis Mg chelatase CobN
VTENPATAAVSARGPANDLGPSFYSDTVGAAPVNGPSVAEVAAQYKTQQNAQGVKTYTNADIPPQSSGSMNSPMMASNAQPPLLGSSASARSGAAEPQTQANSGTQQQTAQQTNENGTTPQVNQPQSQPTQSQRSPAQQSQNENQSLPSTSTFLPLLGLLGIATSGLGIWYRKHRK